MRIGKYIFWTIISFQVKEAKRTKGIRLVFETMVFFSPSEKGGKSKDNYGFAVLVAFVLSNWFFRLTDKTKPPQNKEIPAVEK